MRTVRIGLGLALLVSAGTAWACADSSCYPRWTLMGGARQCEDRGFLAPGNDTRVNLNFLLADRVGSASGARYAPASYGSAGYGAVFLDPYVQQASLFGQPNRRAYDDQAAAASPSAYTGTRCASYEQATRDLAAAMQANAALPAAERSALLAARGQAEVVCKGTGGDASLPARIPAWPAVASRPGQDFVRYMQGSDAFYADDFAAARTAFAALAGAGDGWVREAAGYMLIRTEYAAAQAVAEDSYGDHDPAKVDRAAVKRGLEANARYLAAWPQGRYAASAQGLVRRGLWLAQDFERLARLYEQQVESAAQGPAAADLAFEIDNKWLFNPAAKGVEAKAPIMLAVQDLYAMRSEVDEGGTPWREPTLTAAQLAAQQGAFAGAPDLYGLLQATHALYLAKDPRRVLQLVPDDTRRTAYTNLQFSRQVLRGQALAALKDRNEEGFWLALLGGAKGLWQRPTVELGLALNWERSGKLARVFAKDSPIRETMIRRELLIHAASADMLRTAARDTARGAYERDLAAYVLLYKDLSRGFYADFLADRAVVRPAAASEGYTYFLPDGDSVPAGAFVRGKWSDGYACPGLDQTARALAANPQAVSARLCLADFWRLNGFDGLAGPDERNKPDELGGTASLFPGTPSPRGAIYAGLLADPAVRGPDKAYTLYRAVMCYAPSGYNSCGGKGVGKSQRKAWYDQLKREFPASPWAKKLRYYW